LVLVFERKSISVSVPLHANSLPVEFTLGGIQFFSV
jgi:hypothetical protein